MPEISSQTTEVPFNTEATEIENKMPDNGKFITTPEFNILTNEKFDDLVDKNEKKSRETTKF